VWFRAPAFENILKKLNYFYIYFLIFSYYFDMLMSKIIFKNKKKYYFNIFSSKKYFKKQLLFDFQAATSRDRKGTKPCLVVLLHTSNEISSTSIKNVIL
jgi:hypothetical protein